MSTHTRILVTSAAGKTGLPVTLQLLEKGFAVRAFVRRQDHRAQQLKEAGAEIFVGDQYALTDMRAAMKGVQRAYQCAPTAPNGLHYNAVFTAAAFEARLEHVVTLGQWLSTADHPSLFTRETYLGDILIRMPGDMTVTSIIPGWFADNYLMVLDMAAHLGLFAMPLGAGDVPGNAPPSNEDIASVAVAALGDPEVHAGKTYRPTGPVLLSPNEIAAAMGQALGRRVKYRNISEKMMMKALRAMPPANFSQAAASQLALYTEEYRRGTFAISAPTDHVLRIGGRVPEPFVSIVKRRVAARSDLRRSFPRRLGAMAGFARMLLTPALVPKEIEAQRDYVRLAAPAFSQDDAEWGTTHRHLGLS
ncbi:NmrA family NAD(P)-binding protein [uncultured Roseobacter sp.]|uniref:NmrA family NAD(P)-binding protein n=1 Tax=uncultured Roseobacter sp. TaxID=114847 RepID=UPI0026207280|nr:NmrA family NAD(P)-binding protein [uncultured Roseobacter sp.]